MQQKGDPIYGKNMRFKEKLIPKIPNILTFFRIILVPFFIYSLFGKSVFSGLAALLVFIIASISDYFDGYFARKWNIHTRLGEFIDPFADKILTGGAFVSFVILRDFYIPYLLVALILLREIIVTFFRLIALKKKKPIKTEYSGKVKTAFQMFTVICVLVILFIKKIFLSIRPGLINKEDIYIWTDIAGTRAGGAIYYAPLILISISAFIALFSMVQYISKNREIIFTLSKKSGIDLVVKFFSTGFFIGYIPAASGTFGALIGAVFWILLSKYMFYYAVTVFFVALGIVISGYAENKIFFEKDSSRIVIDEIAGMLIALLSFQFSLSLSGILYLVSGFLLFRIFDIIKPPPIRNVQKYRAGIGIMLDDIIAAIFTNGLLQVLRFFIPFTA